MNPTRERILTTAIESLRNLDTAQLLGAVGVRDLARLAGVGTSSLYHHVGSLQGLADAVEDQVFYIGPDLTPGLPAVVELAEVAFPLDAALALHVDELQLRTTEPDFRPRLGVWALGGERAAASYRTRLRTLDERFSTPLTHLYASWGREPRPPFDTATILSTLVCLLVGTTIRELAEPDPARRVQFPLASVVVSSTLLREAGDHRDVDARLADLTYLPSARDDGTRRTRSDTTRTRVFLAAAELFRRQGYEETTVAQIARRAGLSPRTVHLHVGSKRELAITLLHTEATDRLPAPTATDPASALHEHLLALATFARDRRRYLEPYLTELSLGGDAASDVLIERTAALLEAHASDATADGPDDVEDAVVLVLAIGHHAMRAPTVSAEAIVDDVWPLVGST